MVTLSFAFLFGSGFLSHERLAAKFLCVYTNPTLWLSHKGYRIDGMWRHAMENWTCRIGVWRVKYRNSYAKKGVLSESSLRRFLSGFQVGPDKCRALSSFLLFIFLFYKGAGYQTQFLITNFKKFQPLWLLPNPFDLLLVLTLALPRLS